MRYWSYKRHKKDSYHLRLIAKAIDDVFAGKIKRLIVNMPPRHGKAIDENEMLPTPSGMRAAKDIAAGDYLIGSAGRPVLVKAVYPQGVTDAYECRFTDGSSVVTCSEHIWTARRRGKADRRKPWRDVLTKDLVNDLSEADGRKKWRIPTVKSDGQDDDIDLPVDPYLFGCWLGDGSFNGSDITTMDDEVVRSYEARGYVLEPRKHQNSGKATTYKVSPSFPNKVMTPIRRTKTKHIPEIFFKASYSQRLEMLRGLMDTDGSVGRASKVVEFAQKDGPLVDDFVRLCGSLGVITRKYKSWIDGRLYWKISLACDVVPFRLSRKVSAFRACKKKPVKRLFDSITKVEDRRTVCFTVDADDHLFCVGLEHVLTHNTLEFVEMMSVRCIAVNAAAQIMHLSYSDTLVRKNSVKVKNTLRTPEFQATFPEVQIAKDTEERWTTTKGGEFYAATTNGQVTGFECGRDGDPFDGFLVIDDPQKAKGALSKKDCENMQDVVGNAITTRLNHDDTPVIVIQQRLGENDVSAWLMSGGTGEVWDVLCLQALTEDGMPPAHYREYSHARILNYRRPLGALWPARRSEEKLNQIKNATDIDDTDNPRGLVAFNAQYQQNPGSQELSLYDVSWLRDKRDPSRVYILDATRKRCEFPDLVDWVVQNIERTKLYESPSINFSLVTIEDANVGSALKATVDSNLKNSPTRVRIEMTPKYGSKFDRAMEALPFIQQGRLLVPMRSNKYTWDVDNDGNKQFIKEFKKFNLADTHESDDLLDPAIWELVTRYGNAPKTAAWNYGAF